MRDRVPGPGKANRIRLTQDDGQTIEGVLSYADDATQEGSAYTKGNVLPDEVCDILGLDRESSEPRDAFCHLGLINASVYGQIRLVGKTSAGNPLAGAQILIGSTAVTADERGVAVAKLSPGTYTAKFISLDIDSEFAEMQVVSEKGKITEYTYSGEFSELREKLFSASAVVGFSARVSDFDIFAVGAGGSGGAAVCNRSPDSSDSSVAVAAAGGAGGKAVTQKNIVPNGKITITIGAGAAAVSAKKYYYPEKNTGGQSVATEGKAGGSTTVSMTGMATVTASGGGKGEVNTYGSSYPQAKVTGASGGSGSGGVYSSYNTYPTIGASGGDGANGGDAISDAATKGGTGQGTTTKPFGENAGTAYSPAGGSAGGNSKSSNSYAKKGSVAAGGAQANAVQTSSRGTATAEDATVFGGGGGAAVCAGCETDTSVYCSFVAFSGKGQSGCVILRWRVSA